MPRAIPVNHLEDPKYLQDFSQCAFDILQIIKTVIAHPGEYKELHLKYFDLLNLLKEKMLLEDSFKFKENRYILPSDFLYLPYREEADRKVLYKAETNLRFLVHEIENKRHEVLGNKYKPHTGVKDPELKKMLANIKNGSDNQPLKPNEGKQPNEDTDGGQVIHGNNEIVSEIINNKRILKNGLKRVDIGSISNAPNKLWEALTPFGNAKLINTVFSITNPIKGKYTNASNLTMEEKEKILNDRFKEIQSYAKKINSKVTLKFNKQNQTLWMEVR